MRHLAYTESVVLDKIRDDSTSTAWFAREPRRTGFYVAIALGMDCGLAESTPVFRLAEVCS